MRRIIESTFVTLDGIIGDPRAWAGEIFDPTAQAGALEDLRASDAMLMGRGTYEYCRPGLADPERRLRRADQHYAQSTCSPSTLKTADWTNTTIIRDDPITAVTELKKTDGNDLVIYGHGRFAQSLLHHQLIDELRLAIQPLVLGDGQRIVDERFKPVFALVSTRTLTSGVTAVTYRPAGD